MHYDYDVIVIGAGNGGLVAGATTAKAGLKTLVLEKHNLPGGSASSFRRGRFEFEPSLHELCSVGTKENPSAVYNLFADLGISPQWCYEDSTFRVINTEEGNEYDVKLRAGMDNFLDDMEKAVPGCRKSVKNFFDLYHKINAALDYVDEKKGNPNPLVMVLKHGDFMRCASHSVEEVQIALGMPEKARDILNTYWAYLGVPTDELNCLHYISMVYSYIVDSAAMPLKRSHQLSTALANAIIKFGGEIRYRSEVVKMLYDETGKACGVKIKSGEEFYAKEIISNVIPNNVYNISDEKYVPEREIKLANSRELGLTFHTIYIGLDKSAEELGIKDYTLFLFDNSKPRTQYETMGKSFNFVVNCLNMAIPDATPQGTSTLFFTIPTFGRDLPKDLKPEDYKKFKNDIALRYIKKYEEIMGVDVLNHIEEISVATPVTFARYLNTPDGEVYGYQVNKWDSILARITSKQLDFTVKGLTYCGGHDTRGDGYSSAYINGSQAGNAVVRRLKGE